MVRRACECPSCRRLDELDEIEATIVPDWVGPCGFEVYVVDANGHLIEGRCTLPEDHEGGCVQQ